MKSNFKKVATIFAFITLLAIGNAVESHNQSTYLTSRRLTERQVIDDQLTAKASFYGIHINFEDKDKNNNDNKSDAKSDTPILQSAQFWGVPQLHSNY